ncbi:CDP-glycerol glycerophosphotransferase family protein [Photobacterium profundum]|uniref:Uncharacterized protein n=1 Tax=Photobacterium profundum (strain SS9) TaxID=298386 RepID=Q6LNR5_PHOPR|nr:CDP-glycerol glycerophosphotransferase family protein [Photobacterium profundum]CAG21061.1 hypothetical protein PBPRA2683 [Photobacterium profundum SS9]
MEFKKYIRLLIFKMVWLLDIIIPKNNHQILFSSNSRNVFSGNSKALYNDFINDENFIIKYTVKSFNNDINYIDIKSLRGVWYFLRSRVVIGTHGLSDFYYDFSSRKIFIQTWHGTPLKKLGLCDENNANNLNEVHKHIKKISYFLSPSNMVSSSLVRCFGLPENKLLEIGYPRNDCLIKSSCPNELHSKYKAKRVILYAPTFRDWTSVVLFPFENFEYNQLEKLLDKLDAVLLVRSHVNEKFKTDCISDRIISFDSNECVDVNDILGEVDLLITDYSSIYFDYLLLDRPSIFIPYDLEEYREKRGFLYDDYDNLMVGDKVYNQEEFLDSIKSNFEYDKYSKLRSGVNNMLNYYQTDNTSSYIKKLLINKYTNSVEEKN